jgi:transposase
MKILAFDVSKDFLDLYNGTSYEKIVNGPKSIDAVLKQYSPKWVVVMEPTSVYHLELAERAFRKGFTVYLVNPRSLSKFREGRKRCKTDKIDSECLHTFCERNHQDLRAWAPLAPDLEKLRKAIKRYHKATQLRTTVVQSFGTYPCVEKEEVVKTLIALQEKLEKEVIEAAKKVDEDYYNRLQSAPGFGPYSACAFTFLMRSRSFEDPDAVRAFVGLDLQFKDSGKKKGKRTVTHCGDSSLRHAACCAGRGLLNSRYGKSMNQDLKAKGRESIERVVMASRKQIRVAYALAHCQESFNPEKFTWKLDTKT